MSAPISPKSVKFQDEIARDLRRQQQIQQQQQRQVPPHQNIGPRRSSAFQPTASAQYAVPHAHRHQSVPAQQQQHNDYDGFVLEEPVEQTRSLHQPVPKHFAPLPPAQRIGVLQQQVSQQMQQPSGIQQQIPQISQPQPQISQPQPQISQPQPQISQPQPVKMAQPRAVRPPEPTKPFQPIIQPPITTSSTIGLPVQQSLKVSPVSTQMTSSFTRFYIHTKFSII